jgi:hypothetical protein
MMRHRIAGRFAASALALLLVACDRSTAPEVGKLEPDLPDGAVLMQCVADVRAGQIHCETPPPPPTPSGLHSDRIVGGQDLYVQLSSAGTSYDAGTEILSSTVTVENLTRLAMGTSDGSTVNGVKVFFQDGPTVTSGTGTVTVANADGTDTFTGTGQPYFLYPQILAPMEISDGRVWMFSAPSTVNTFAFTVYVATTMVDEHALMLGPVWTGADSTSNWFTAANWSTGEVPDSTMAATIPTDTVLGGASLPALGNDASVQHLRVGSGSVLDLGGHVMTVAGNVDARGAVSNGTVRLTSDSTLAGGTLPSLAVEGSVHLQRPTTATGSVEVTGTLTIQDLPLSIRIP